ncbi:MAG: protease B nonderepressible form [Candelina mexicana]|nr:MAG: protease B nonderepressible form [Candelina mexicana]
MKQRTTFVHQLEDAFTPDQIRFAASAVSINSLKAAREDRLTFGLDELPKEETFTRNPLLSERFSHSSTFQYYQILPSLANLVAYLQQHACTQSNQLCLSQVSRLQESSYVDVDFDAISPAVVLTAFWDRPISTNGVWEETMRIAAANDRVEIGILANEKPIEPEELNLGGFLTIVGEDEKPSPTLFSFPSRHHPLRDSFYAVSIIDPPGLHPSLRISFPQNLSKPDSMQGSCALHAYLTLPSHVFVDKYQLSDYVFLASKNLKAMRSISGEPDLEAPDWAVQKWGSNLLVELSPSSESEGGWDADIPLHLRYLPPALGGIAEVSVPWPVVFWACRAEEGLKMNVNPFDRVNLGYDGLFGPRTMFCHVSPKPGSNCMEKIQLPVINALGTQSVEIGTSTAIVMGFIWIWWCLFSKSS